MRRFRGVSIPILMLVACTSTPPSEPQTTVGTHFFAHAFPGATLGAKINAAINALPPTGGIVDATDFTGPQRIDQTVILGAGGGKAVELRLGGATISASVVPFQLGDGAKLLGNGSTIVTQDAGANLEWLITGTNIADCEIAGLTVDGNRQGNTGAGSGIGLHTAKRCWLHQLVVRNTVGRLHPGIAFFDDGNADNTVEHNLVQDIGTLADYADGIYVAGPGNKVLFNRIRNATDFGIVGESCVGCVIQGNDLVNVPAGISVGSGIASFNAAANIIDANVITGGSTTTWGAISIYRINGGPPVATLVRGNVIRDVDVGHGIFVNGAEQVTLADNVISNIGLTTPSYGILIINSKDVGVSGGSISRTGTFGLGIGASTNVSVNDVRITDAGRSGNDAAGVGLDALSTHSSAISLTQLHVFDTDTIAQLKKMAFCIDFGQGGTTSGVVIGGNLFDDGVNALGCRIGTVNFNNASRVTAY
jgi:hypothetical protein